jgi:hypothetical protein
VTELLYPLDLAEVVSAKKRKEERVKTERMRKDNFFIGGKINRFNEYIRFFIYFCREILRL